MKYQFQILLCFFALLCLVQACAALTNEGAITVNPPQVNALKPGDAVSEVSGTIKLPPSGDQTFATKDTVEFYTHLNNAKWSVSIIVGGIENPAKTYGGHRVSINGWELAYPTSGYEEGVKIKFSLTDGVVPPLSSGTIILFQAQELDSSSTQVGAAVYKNGSVINPAALQDQVNEMKAKLAEIKTSIDEKAALGVDTTVALQKYSSAKADLDSATRALTGSPAEVNSLLTDAGKAGLEAAEALDMAWAQMTIEEADARITSVTGLLDEFRVNRSIKDSDTRLVPIINKYDLAARALSDARNEFSSKSYTAVRTDAGQSFVYATDAWNLALSLKAELMSGAGIPATTVTAITNTLSTTSLTPSVTSIPQTIPSGSYQFIAKWGSPGDRNGQFRDPVGIAVDSSGNVYVADGENCRIQKFDSNGKFLTEWGSRGSGNGQFNVPMGIAVDPTGNVFVSDFRNFRIQKFDTNGHFLAKWGNESEEMDMPVGIALDDIGNIYVADTAHNLVKKFASTGVFISSWDSGGLHGGLNNGFNYPVGVAVDASRNLYVLDSKNNRVQKFDSNANFINKWGSEGSGDGQFINPYGIAVDIHGNVYVADRDNNRIQKFDSNGNFLTKWGLKGSGNGEFDLPMGIAVQASDIVYVVDTYNQRIQKFRGSAQSSPPIVTLTITPTPGDGQLTPTSNEAEIIAQLKRQNELLEEQNRKLAEQSGLLSQMITMFQKFFGIFGIIHTTPSPVITTNPSFTTLAPSPIITTRHPRSVAATARQSGYAIQVSWEGGPDNSDVLSYNVNIKDSTTPYGEYPPVVGNTTTIGGGTAGNDHVVVVAVFTDGSSQVVLDTYV
jgi:hypothetical protein